MNWFKLIKTAKEIGHGDTFEGQLYKREMERLAKEVDKLRTVAATGGPQSVLPRWRGEIRHKILLLPAKTAIVRMSMHELRQLSSSVTGIRELMDHYNAKRFKDIMGDAN